MSNYIHYRDYTGSLEFSEEDGVLYGKVIGIKDMISFERDSVKALTEDFHNAVDEYLDFCKKNGKQPEKPFKGSFNVRILIALLIILSDIRQNQPIYGVSNLKTFT